MESDLYIIGIVDSIGIDDSGIGQEYTTGISWQGVWRIDSGIGFGGLYILMPPLVFTIVTIPKIMILGIVVFLKKLSPLYL